MAIISKHGKMYAGMSAGVGAVDAGVVSGVGALVTGGFSWPLFLCVGAIATGVTFVALAMAKVSGDASAEEERVWIKAELDKAKAAAQARD